jgi:four helix bundle protein
VKIERFEEIIAWQKAKDLVIFCYDLSEKWRDFSFRDQFRRAAVSIMNNIAEGFERRGDREFKHFLFISKGSCGEVRSMSYLADEFKYLDNGQFKLIADKSTEISKILSGLIKSLDT